MLRHLTRLLIIALACCLPLAALSDLARTGYGGIKVPPQEVTYRVTQDGPTLRWWQASNATDVAILTQCGPTDELRSYEPGAPGWHQRSFPTEPLGSCLRINEFYEGEYLGTSGLISLAPDTSRLPFVAR
jgi:hypothetical protein